MVEHVASPMKLAPRKARGTRCQHGKATFSPRPVSARHPANAIGPRTALLCAGSDLHTGTVNVRVLRAGGLRHAGGFRSARGARGAGGLRSAGGTGNSGSARGAGHAGSLGRFRSAAGALVCRGVDLCSALGALNGAGFDSGWSEAHIVSFL